MRHAPARHSRRALTCGVALSAGLLASLVTVPAAAASSDADTVFLSTTLGAPASVELTLPPGVDGVYSGDWNGDGRDSVGYRIGNRFVLLADDGSSTYTSFAYGRVGDDVFVGDWNGDGRDTLAVRRGNIFYFTDELRGGVADRDMAYGRVGDEVLIADWSRTGRATPAVRRGNIIHVSMTLTSGVADESFAYGRAADDIVVGDWDGDGVATPAVRRGNTFHVSNSFDGGDADFITNFGRPTDQALAGDWNGSGADSLGVHRPARSAGFKAEAWTDGAAGRAPIGPGDGDGVFTLVQFNDTQADVWADHQKAIPARVNWILGNQRTHDIRFAVHTGDVVNWWESRTNNAQYRRADRWLQPLSDSPIPFAVAVGNHDTLAVADGQGWANSDPVTGRSLASWGLRQTQLINSIFPASDFRNMRGQMEAGKFDNSFHTFTAEGADFLVLSIEMWPRPQALDWAERVVREHPRHNVIVLNHSYLDQFAHVQADNGGYGTSPSTAIRDRIVAKYPNVKLVLSGHAGTTNARVDQGSGGNVLSILTNLSGTDRGELRLFEIDVAGGEVRTDLVYTATDGSRGHHAVRTPITWIR